ncbi:hypothetical protein [Persicobacter psychrovividus]|uniref:DUF4595 domain-containing protein n=1 Tax=Persicobacter psychrovividus TaxID=387638 RepID=A0ABM7VF92_9BACT|nr:hypothetical protein PEPS_18910 [Persicobacter psychrovividus]
MKTKATTALIICLILSVFSCTETEEALPINEMMNHCMPENVNVSFEDTWTENGIEISEKFTYNNQIIYEGDAIKNLTQAIITEAGDTLKPDKPIKLTINDEQQIIETVNMFQKEVFTYDEEGRISQIVTYFDYSNYRYKPIMRVLPMSIDRRSEFTLESKTKYSYQGESTSPISANIEYSNNTSEHLKFFYQNDLLESIEIKSSSDQIKFLEFKYDNSSFVGPHLPFALIRALPNWSYPVLPQSLVPSINKNITELNIYTSNSNGSKGYKVNQIKWGHEYNENNLTIKTQLLALLEFGESGEQIDDELEGVKLSVNYEYQCR